MYVLSGMLTKFLPDEKDPSDSEMIELLKLVDPRIDTENWVKSKVRVLRPGGPAQKPRRLAGAHLRPSFRSIFFLCRSR